MQFDQNSDVVKIARATLPTRGDGEPLFRAAWHARVFALMVALVNANRIPWKAFQECLVEALKEEQDPAQGLCEHDVDLQYFECWLVAAETTLIQEGFVDLTDVTKQIAAIRASVLAIREGQTHSH